VARPKRTKTKFQERKGEEDLSREDLKGNAVSIFLGHNIDRDKWWNDQQIRKVPWRTKNLKQCILTNEDKTREQI
jgi:hypothetical protein